MPRMRSKWNRSQHGKTSGREDGDPTWLRFLLSWLTVSDVHKPTLSTGEGALPTALSTGKMDWVSYTGNYHHNYKQHFKLCGGHFNCGKLRRVTAADSGGPWFEPWSGEGLFLVIFLSPHRINQIRPRLYLPEYISFHHLTIGLQNYLLIYCKLKYLYKSGLECYLGVCTKCDRNNAAISRDFGNYEGRGEHLGMKLASAEAVFSNSNSNTKTHTHTHTHIYIYMCVCVCVCVFGNGKWERRTLLSLRECPPRRRWEIFFLSFSVGPLLPIHCKCRAGILNLGSKFRFWGSVNLDGKKNHNCIFPNLT